MNLFNQTNNSLLWFKESIVNNLSDLAATCELLDSIFSLLLFAYLFLIFE